MANETPKNEEEQAGTTITIKVYDGYNVRTIIDGKPFNGRTLGYCLRSLKIAFRERRRLDYNEERKNARSREKSEQGRSRSPAEGAGQAEGRPQENTAVVGSERGGTVEAAEVSRTDRIERASGDASEKPVEEVQTGGGKRAVSEERSRRNQAAVNSILGRGRRGDAELNVAIETVGGDGRRDGGDS